MARHKLPATEVTEMVEAASNAVAPLSDLVRQCRNCAVEPLDNDALKLVKALVIASRDCADAAMALMSHIDLSNQDRAVEELRRKAEL